MKDIIAKTNDFTMLSKTFFGLYSMIIFELKIFPGLILNKAGKPVYLSIHT